MLWLALSLLFAVAQATTNCFPKPTTPSCVGFFIGQPLMQISTVLVGSSPHRSKLITTNYPKPFENIPNLVLQTQTSVSTALGVYAITVVSKSNVSFSARIMRLDAPSWNDSLSFVFIAWDKGYAPPLGMMWGSTAFPNTSSTSSPFQNTGTIPTRVSLPITFNGTLGIPGYTRVFASAYIPDGGDKNAVYTLTTGSTSSTGAVINAERVDSSWTNNLLEIAYIVWGSHFDLSVVQPCSTCQGAPPWVESNSFALTGNVYKAKFGTLTLNPSTVLAPMTFNITFSYFLGSSFAFNSTPSIVAMPRTTATGEVFSLSIVDRRTTGFTIDITPVGTTINAQQLMIDWMAFLQQTSDIIPLTSGVPTPVTLVLSIYSYFSFQVLSDGQDIVLTVSANGSAISSCGVFVSRSFDHPSPSVLQDVLWLSQTGLLRIFSNDPNYGIGTYYVGIESPTTVSVNVTVTVAQIALYLPYAHAVSISPTNNSWIYLRMQLSAFQSDLRITATHSPTPNKQTPFDLFIQKDSFPTFSTVYPYFSRTTTQISTLTSSQTQTVWEFQLNNDGNYYLGIYSSNVTQPFSTAIYIDSFDVSAGNPAVSRPYGVAVNPQNVHNEIWLDDLPLNQRTLARNSVAFGPGLSVAIRNVPTYFYIRSKDRFGNLRQLGGDIYTVIITDNAGNVTNATAIDEQNGLYFVSFSIANQGMYSINITLWGMPIHFNPFTGYCDATLILLSSGVSNTVTLDYAEYQYYQINTVDWLSDLTISVNCSFGSEVFLSSHISYPSSFNPTLSDYILSSVSNTGAFISQHFLRLPYSDPKYIVGAFYIGVKAVEGVQTTVCTTTAVTSQVARNLAWDRIYGDFVQIGSSCGSCSGIFSCISGYCRQYKQYRITLSVGTSIAAFVVRLIGQTSGISVYLNANAPADINNYILSALNYTTSPGVYTLTLSTNTSASPLVGTTYYLTVVAWNASSNYSYTVQTVLFNVNAEISPPPLSIFQNSVFLAPQTPLTVAPTLLISGSNVSGIIGTGMNDTLNYAFYQIAIPDKNTELSCRVALYSGSIDFLLSISDFNPSLLRPQNLIWRADGQIGSAALDWGATQPLFAVATYYLALHARQLTNYSMICTLTRIAPTIYIGGAYNANVQRNGYAYFRFSITQPYYRLIITAAPQGEVGNNIALYINQNSFPTTTSYLMMQGSLDPASGNLILSFRTGTHPQVGAVYYIGIYANASATATTHNLHLGIQGATS